jgi:signal transduction histidine kinase
MKISYRGIWRYTWQMLALLVIASVAVHSTVSFLEDQIANPAADGRILPFGPLWVFWAMVVGFMFLVGGLSLWTLQFATESESLRRVGNLVDAMKMIKDALVSLDAKGHITGSNPTAATLALTPPRKGVLLREVFPCLSEEDLTLLLDPQEPNEVERLLIKDNASRTLRFRSQPSDGMTILLISDVTQMLVREKRRQQLARWQLIGRIARGIAHDFNNLLCVISSHVSLLSRMRSAPPEIHESLQAIRQESNLGAILAAKLINLSSLAAEGQPTLQPGEHIRQAAKLLTPSLPLGWTINTQIAPDLPPIALSGEQLEQVTLNLGLLVADAMDKPGALWITIARPGTDHLTNIGDQYAAVLLVSADATSSGLTSIARPSAEYDENEGMVQSVVQSILENAGGALHVLKGNEGSRIYRSAIPFGAARRSPDSRDNLDQCRNLLAGRKVLSAGSPSHHLHVNPLLTAMGAQVIQDPDMVSVLGHIETETQLDVLLIEQDFLGPQAEGLLRAIGKLCPRAGIVVLGEPPDHPLTHTIPQLLYANPDLPPTQLGKVLVAAQDRATSHALPSAS